MENPLISNDTIALPFDPNKDETNEKSAANDGLQSPDVEMQQGEKCQSEVSSIGDSHNRFNTISKNISTPIFDNSLNAINPKSTELTTPNHALISVGDNSAALSSHKTIAAGASSHHNTLDIVPQNFLIQQSKSRLAVKFLLKKSQRFCGALRVYLTKPVTTSSSKLKSIMFSIKNSFKNTLAITGPTSKTITQIASSLVSKLTGQRLPECLRLLGYSLRPINKRKKGSAAILPVFQSGQEAEFTTFLNPVKKPEIATFEGFQFVKPKVYECGYCDTKFFKLPVYLKHIRRHAEIIRCESCGKAFSSDINKRRHRLQCRKKAIL